MIGAAITVVGVLVDMAALGETVAAAFVAGIGITAIFSAGLFGAARCADMSRDGRQIAATSYGLLSALSFLSFGAIIVVGLMLMIG